MWATVGPSSDHRARDPRNRFRRPNWDPEIFMIVKLAALHGSPSQFAKHPRSVHFPRRAQLAPGPNPPTRRGEAMQRRAPPLPRPPQCGASAASAPARRGGGGRAAGRRATSLDVSVSRRPPHSPPHLCRHTAALGKRLRTSELCFGIGFQISPCPITLPCQIPRPTKPERYRPRLALGPGTTRICCCALSGHATNHPSFGPSTTPPESTCHTEYTHTQAHRH